MADERVPGGDETTQESKANGQTLLNVYIDFLSNSLRPEECRDYLREKALSRIDEAAVFRFSKLPTLLLKEPDQEYLNLLLEARELYYMGLLYPCVAMCGIVGERLVKDVLRECLLIGSCGNISRPKEKSLDQLERVDLSAIVQFLNTEGILHEEAAKAARTLLELRNRYAHARGSDPEADAAKAISALHIVVEHTVSFFKDHQIVNGTIVPKANVAG